MSKVIVAGSSEKSMSVIRALIKRQDFKQFIYLPLMSKDPNNTYEVLDLAVCIFAYARQKLEDVTDAKEPERIRFRNHKPDPR